MRKLIIIIACVLLLTCVSIPTIKAENIEQDHFSHYVMDASSGKVMSAYREHDRHEIASMVKIMTLNIVLDHIERGDVSLDEKIVISNNAASVTGSELFIDAGSEYSISDLVKGVIVVSANDAATALAERIANNTDNFVHLMNDKTSEWGLADTHFVNVTGLPHEGQYSSAYDVSIMMRHLLSHDVFFDYSKIWTEDYIHPSGRLTNLTNTNKLVRFYKGCDGGKTGYTDKALYCLSATATRDDMRVISTVIGCKSSKDRFALASNLMNRAFGEYENMIVKRHGDEIENNIKINRAQSKRLSITYANDIKVLINKSNKPSIKIEYELPDHVSAPISKGDKIGVCHVIVANEHYIDVDVVATEDIERDSIWNNIGSLFR